MIMRMKHLLKRSEREAIGDRFGDSPVMDAFHGACLRLGGHGATYALSGEDLFYHCFFSIDELLGRREKDARTYCSYLWDEMHDFIGEKWDAADEADVRLAASTIVDGVAELLVRTGVPRFTAWAGILKKQIEVNPPGANVLMDGAFGEGFGATDQMLVMGELNEYFGNEELWSEEMEGLMDGVAAAEPLRAASGQTNIYNISGNVTNAGCKVGKEVFQSNNAQRLLKMQQ